MKKRHIFVLGVILISILILVAYTLLKTGGEDVAPLAPRPTIAPAPEKDLLPPRPNTLPTLMPNQGAGVDLESEEAVASKNEIQKVVGFLPLTMDEALSTGIDVSIVIPKPTSLDPEWFLYVYVFGIDYQVPANSPDYSLMRSSFLEAASVVFDWLEEKDVDPSRLIIVWGDKKEISDRAEQWLYEKN